MQQTTREDAIEKVATLISDIRIAMLVTMDANGRPRSRPMMTQPTEFDGTLWFFSSSEAEMVREIAHEPHVNLAYASTASESYLSVSGSAQVVDDRARARELWSPLLRGWFDSPEDPLLRLIRIDVEEAEYWDTPGGKVASLFSLLKGAITGDSGDNNADVGRVAL
ncbi:MAG: pyridoxamine 5'-phosphate oxidase family protein [Gemmatimonadetes bacterium]|nr:pyridoxamine 5'-phosphate oxidase family protein [Gemmatimonadota bacterium]